MGMREGVDYSWGRPGGKAIREAGRDFAVRYVFANTGKEITIPEIHDLHDNGVDICIVFEGHGERAATGGYGGGMNDAISARQQMRAMGYPDNRPIYYAVDQDIFPELYDEVVAYFHGIHNVEGDMTGGYGEYEVMWLLEQYGLIHWKWQCFAWSKGYVYPTLHMYQYQNERYINGVGVDYNRSYQRDFGQWPSPVGVDPDPAVNTEELMSAEYDKLKAELDHLRVAVYSGQEEKDESLATRSANAIYRENRAYDGLASSIADQAASALAIAVKVAIAVSAAGGTLALVAKQLGIV